LTPLEPFDAVHLCGDNDPDGSESQFPHPWRAAKDLAIAVLYRLCVQVVYPPEFISFNTFLTRKRLHATVVMP
jgi:hypothetical protein